MFARTACVAAALLAVVPLAAQTPPDPVVVFPGLTQSADAWDRYRAEAPGRGFQLIVPQFPGIDGQPGVAGHAVNERTIESTMARALAGLPRGGKVQVIVYSQSAPNFLSWLDRQPAARQRAILSRVRKVIVLDPALHQKDLWWMKTPPMRQVLEGLRMRGNWYPSVAELLESDGNRYLADVRASYSRIGTLSRESGTAWTVVTLDNLVVSPKEAARLARELGRAGAAVRFRDTRALFMEAANGLGGDGGVFQRGQDAPSARPAREIYTRGRHSFHLPLSHRSRIHRVIESRRDLEATVREFVWRELRHSAVPPAEPVRTQRRESNDASVVHDLAVSTGPERRTEAGEGPVGGIDFRDVPSGLLYAAMASGEGLSTLALASGSRQGGVEPLRIGVDAMLAALTVDPGAFWVNLHPAEPNRVSDSRLGLASTARVLLQADLELKREIARIIDPRTAAGSEYWRRLAGVEASALRVWIVPGPTRVRLWEGQAFIESALLDVRLESRHLQARGGSADADPHVESLQREVVLPRLREAVNRDARFRDFRAAYGGLVLAHALSAGPGETSAQFPPEWEETGWHPRDIWKEYEASYRNGEFDVLETHTETRGAVTTVRQIRYVAGGVDFTAIGNHPEVVVVGGPPPAGTLSALAHAMAPASLFASEGLAAVVVALDAPTPESGPDGIAAAAVPLTNPRSPDARRRHAAWAAPIVIGALLALVIRRRRRFVY